MRDHSSLSDLSFPIVVDASAAINLNATGHAPQVLSALPHEVVLVDVVYGELENGRPNGWSDAEEASKLLADGLLKLVKLGEAGLQQFERLVVGPAEKTLDDGEAATIAYGLETGAIALIDERKANRICAERFRELQVASTVDILAHGAVQRALGTEGLADAIWNALNRARMRVLPKHLDWVIRLIGPERAAQCSSLPRSSRMV